MVRPSSAGDGLRKDTLSLGLRRSGTKALKDSA